MKKVTTILLCLCSLVFSADFDPIKAQMLSLSCASCHGTDGKSISITPSLAGIEKTTLYKTLLDYKNSKKTGTMMQNHVKGFTDDELEQVSYYFSKVKR